jgi:hypothetical protein
MAVSKFYGLKFYLLVGILLFAILGCGGGDSSNSGTEDTTTSDTTTTVSGVITPDESDVVIDEYGNEIAVNLILVCLNENYSSIEYAEEVASSISGSVVGEVSSISLYQIEVPATSISEIEELLDGVSQHEYVDFAMKEMSVYEDFSSWDQEEEWDSQRETNRVEEGTTLYNNEMNIGTFCPASIGIGISETSPNIDFDLEDFAKYKNDLSYHYITIDASDGIDLTGNDDDAHASVVTGVIAAMVGNGEMGGLLASFEMDGGGFNIVVRGKKWTGYYTDQIVKMIEDYDSEVINISHGEYLDTTVDIDGKLLKNSFSDLGISQRDFDEQQLLWAKLFNSYSDVIFVLAAGNNKVEITSDNSLIAGLGHFYNNVVVVSGHDSAGTSSALNYDDYNFATYRNECFGNNVDIVAASEIGTFKNGKTGTSYSAPLVTATIAAIKSINPDLSPSEIKALLRKSALPISHIDDSHNITSPLTEDEVGSDDSRLGFGARLNVEGAIEMAIQSLYTEVATTTGIIPDTGQTTSYTTTFGEDSDYTINPQSYTKLDASGNDLADSATNWAMVRDNVTGLIWEVKTDDGGIHDKGDTYTWYDSNNATNGGDPGTPGDGTDTEDFIDELNVSNFGGHSDWRLPTRMELAMLINDNKYLPSINEDYFPNTVSSCYWSSTASASSSECAWYVGFYVGSTYVIVPKSYDYFVRAVRGGQLANADFVDNGDGTVTDTSTGLMWQQGEPGGMAWEEALAYCEDLSLAGYTDWRLPNRNELQSIVDDGEYRPAINTVFFPGAEPFNYWSSTTCASHSDYAWPVDFDYGYTHYRMDKLSKPYVRAVRGGQ